MPQRPIVIEESLESALSAISELGRRFTEKIESHTIPPQSLNSRVKFTLAMGAAMVEYAESIELMCRNFNSHSAEPTLRAMQEGTISIKYLLGKPGEARILAASAADAGGTASTVKTLVEYMEGHDLTNFGDSSISDLRDLVRVKEEESDRLVTQLQSLNDPEFQTNTGLPKLIERAKRIDEVVEAEPIRTEEYGFLVLYPHLSAGTHMGIGGISTWINEQPDNLNLNVTETTRTNQLTAYSAFSLASDVVSLVLTELGIGDPDFVTWSEETARAIAPAD